MKKIFELKEQNKTTALSIKKAKQEIKTLQKEGKYAGALQWSIHGTKHGYRLNHIAYCLLRGKLYEQIEKPKEQNKLNAKDWKEITQIQEEYREEDVCSGS